MLFSSSHATPLTPSTLSLRRARRGSGFDLRGQIDVELEVHQADAEYLLENLDKSKDGEDDGQADEGGRDSLPGLFGAFLVTSGHNPLDATDQQPEKGYKTGRNQENIDGALDKPSGSVVDDVGKLARDAEIDILASRHG